MPAIKLLTPDSSRFWPAGQYAPGQGQPSLDKQFVRDYLGTPDRNKTPPGPMLPPDVVAEDSRHDRPPAAIAPSGAPVTVT